MNESDDLGMWILISSIILALCIYFSNLGVVFIGI